MDVERSPDEFRNGSVKRGADRLRPICWIVLLVLTILLIPLLAHKSKSPWLFSRYSLSYTIIILLHIAAISLNVLLLRAPASRWIPVHDFLKTYGFWFWFCLWLVLIVAAFGVSWVAGDADFQNLGFALISFGATAWWLIFFSVERLSPLLGRFAVAAAATLAAFLAAEALMAVFPILSPSVSLLRDQKLKLYEFERSEKAGREFYQSTLTTDAELGYRHKPDFLKKSAQRVGSAGLLEIRTDAWGFFNAEFDPSHPYDVACVGDSFVISGWPVFLQEISGLRVANFGIPSYCPPQYTIVLKRYALKLKPKVILYCLYVNDAIEAAAFDGWEKSGVDWFTYKGGLWFGPPTPHPGRALVKECLLRVSRIYTLIDYAGMGRGRDFLPLQAHPIPYETEKFRLVFDRGSFTHVTDPESPPIKRGLELIRESLDDARRACNEAGVDLIVLLLPPKELVHFDGLKKVTKAEDPVGNVARFYESLQGICTELNLKYYDFTDRFRSEVEKTGNPLYNEVDIHWSLEGNRLMARLAAEILALQSKEQPETR